MALIKLLDTHTINKIAAGEVVERPASVVKELVENSIDAKASSITVEIKNGGIDLIRITDNGKGIPKDEVEIAFLRHATSKIQTAEDLSHVLSLGFRGEALASIGAVSKVELLTKTPHDLTGKRVEVDAGKIISSEEIACPAGTTFIMRQLFYNVPARRAFLKTVSTEASKIADVVYKLALAHPEIAIKYIQNNKLVFQTNGGYDLQRCVFSLYGKETAKDTIPFHYEKDGIELSGLCGLATLARANRNYEFFFINGRYIKSPLLQKAVEEAYKTLITIGKFPFIILHLNLAPEEVDVNVHPTKLEVRFKESDRIYNAVYEGVHHHLSAENLIPKLTSLTPLKVPRQEPTPVPTQVRVESFFDKPQFNKSYDIGKLTSSPLKRQEDFKVAQTVYKPLFENTSKTSSSLSEEASALPSVPAEIPSTHAKESQALYVEAPSSHIKIIDTVAETSMVSPLIHDMNQETAQVNAPYKPVEGLDYKIIGQLFNTYWILEYNDQVMIMDQHSAHERVMYEQYMKDFTTSHVSTQILLVPETMNLPKGELLFIEQNLELLNKLGFGIELFGEESIMIREVPYLFNQPMSLAAFKDMLDSIDLKKVTNLYEMKEAHIIQLACKSAIKAYDQLTFSECKALIESLLTLDNPYTCPHGRPTLVKLSKTDIEKIFKRIQ